MGFRSGAYSESTVVPYTGAPGTEFGGAQTPFTSTTFFPARMWATSYFGTLSGGSTTLVITPAQHRIITPGNPDATLRLYSSLGLRLLYADASSTTAAAATVPTIYDVSSRLDGSTITFNAHVRGTNASNVDNVKTAWVTYTYGTTGFATGGCACWKSIDLTHDTDDLWHGTLNLNGATPGNLRFIVQAGNDAGLLGVQDNGNSYFSLGTVPAAAATTALGLTTGSTSGAYGSTINVTATLTAGSAPVPGKSVLFRIGTSLATAITNSSGQAATTLPANAAAGLQDLTASFAGDQDFAAASATRSYTVSKLPTALGVSGPATSVRIGSPSQVSTVLTSGASGLGPRTVVIILKGTDAITTGHGYTKIVTTDPTGAAELGTAPTLPEGAYQVRAYYNGTIDLNPWTSPASNLVLDDPVYNSSSSTAISITIVKNPQTALSVTAPTTATYGAPDQAIGTSGGSGAGAITFSAGTSTACSIVANKLHVISGTGTCAITATKAADDTYLSVQSAPFPVTVAKASPTISINNIPVTAVYGGSFTPTFTTNGDGATSASSSTPATCTVTSGVVSYVGGGQCTLVPSIAAGTNYLAGSGSAQSFTIAKANQTITFAPATTQMKLGDPDVTLNGSSSSGLPVTFTVAPSGTCSKVSEVVSGATTFVTIRAVGIGTCTITASQAGNANYNGATDVPASIKVIWPFTGFFSPVDNLPVVNLANAGSAIPIKFSLGGNRGLSIFSGNVNPGVAKYTCSASAPTDVIEETVVATTSNLTYDPASNQYNYVWKTAKTYATYCYQLQVKLADGTTYAANFKFK